MNRPELDLVTADTVAVERLVAAKAAYRDKPTPANKAKLAEAKQAVFDLRSYWRGIRELCGSPGFSTAGGNVPTVQTRTRSN